MADSVSERAREVLLSRWHEFAENGIEASPEQFVAWYVEALDAAGLLVSVLPLSDGPVMPPETLRGRMQADARLWRMAYWEGKRAQRREAEQLAEGE